MNTNLNAYKKEETKEIIRLWSSDEFSTTMRTTYAESIGRTYNQCASKASYEKNKGNKGSIRKKRKPVWTFEETEYLVEQWPKRNAKGKKKLCKELGRTNHALQTKYSKTINEIINKPKQLNKKQKPAQIQVTHIKKTVVAKEVIINVGETIIKIPSKTFHVDGVKIDW